MNRAPRWSRNANVALAAPARGPIRRLRLRLAHVERVQRHYLIWDDALSQRWHAAYRKACKITSIPPSSRCPTCGVAGQLRVAYSGGINLIGHAEMWCGRCLTGVVTCRARIPEAALRDDDVRDAGPDFVLVYARHDLPRALRWARATTALLGLLLAVTAVTGVVLWLLDHRVGRVVLVGWFPWVFRGFGVSGAAALFLRLRLRWTRPEYTFPSAATFSSAPDGHTPSPPGQGPGDVSPRDQC
ncbi:hypothetical protein AB0H43_14030 [Hamadaea sp. NPDC050747]|uniref:hypothetical protein n=1 Tax=Hamadaea sp. NPDC050747 TaxID=3155789 RepID=UPI0033D702A5